LPSSSHSISSLPLPTTPPLLSPSSQHRSEGSLRRPSHHHHQHHGRPSCGLPEGLRGHVRRHFPVG
jgi:hypothetical protein